MGKSHKRENFVYDDDKYEAKERRDRERQKAKNRNLRKTKADRFAWMKEDERD